MTKHLAIALLLLVPACKKDKDKPKDEAGEKKMGGGGGGGGGGKGDGTGGGNGDGTGGGSGGDKCPELKVTVDGQPLEGLDFGNAVTMENAGYKTQMIDLFNRSDVPCEDALTGSHMVKEGELSVRAFFGAYPGVAIDAYTELQGKLTLDKATDVVGEVMEICVREPVVFTPNAGAYSGKKVSIVGRFSGKYCGVNKS